MLYQGGTSLVYQGILWTCQFGVNCGQKTKYVCERSSDTVIFKLAAEQWFVCSGEIQVHLSAMFQTKWNAIEFRKIVSEIVIEVQLINNDIF